MASQPLRVLAIEPYYGGSHRRFLDDVIANSRHDWTLIHGKPIHWKWRMRSAPLELAQLARQRLVTMPSPDLVFCTDMLDLPQWQGLLRDPRILLLPTVIYFHENQWTYPVSSQARTDAHYGYTNLLSAIAADVCWFNSQYHKNDFLTASEAFVRRMPDAASAHDFATLKAKCEVVAPGFSPPLDRELFPTVPPKAAAPADRHALRIGWVSRWEHDKRPDRFARLLELLSKHAVDFDLVLLGARTETPGRSKPDESLQRIRRDYRRQIIHDGYATSRQEYWRQLSQLDVVISTADHEFFGIGICEAIWAGAVPILPDRLSYPELAIEECLYDSLPDAALRIKSLTATHRRQELSARCRDRLERYRTEHVVEVIDKSFDRLA